MNLRQINDLWNEYKEKYDLPEDIQISAVQYDAEKYVEGFFNILELLEGKYILLSLIHISFQYLFTFYNLPSLSGKYAFLFFYHN